ncbi:MAG: LytTR family DNA-binding domain-containing protein [Bacteroidales bacterium]|nr:LytTR family DNA-binding domain-containing protein [Bacteroidales bacterium]
MIKVIAIDDEPLALRQLEMYIGKVPFLKLVASCSSCAAAKPLIKDADALFLDINMPDLTGMDFIKSLPEPPAVVFTTAYSEYAVEGFRVNAVDYLLKPFSFKEFSDSCEKLRTHLEMEAALRARETEPILHFKADYRTVSVDVRRIVYVEGMSEYVRIFLSGQEAPVIVLYSLKHLVEQLPDNRFMRIHKSYIVALDHISEASRTSVILDNGRTLPVGEMYRPAFAGYLDSVLSPDSGKRQ